MAFWMIFRIATGLKAAVGRKLSPGGVMTVVMVPWTLVGLGQATIAGRFG